MIAVAVVLRVLLPWQRLPRFAMLVAPLVYVLAASGFGPGHAASGSSRRCGRGPRGAGWPETIRSRVPNNRVCGKRR